MTSPAIISPTTEGTNELLPGTCLRWVHFRAVPGGQMQCARQLIAMSSIGVSGGSLEYTTFSFCMPLRFSSRRMTFASGQTDVL